MKQLSATLEERVLNPGELLITKGAVGDAMFFIMEGHAEVRSSKLTVAGPHSSLYTTRYRVFGRFWRSWTKRR